MQGVKVAERYAEALLNLSIEKKLVDTVVKDMRILLATANENEDFTNFLSTPLVKEDKKAKILHHIFSDFQEITTKFNELITRNKREVLLPLIAEEFIKKVNEINGIVPVTLTTADPLDAKVKESILEKLKIMIKGSVELTEEIDEDLIGGFTVRMGDTKIDASIALQLNNLKQRLMQ